MPTPSLLASSAAPASSRTDRLHLGYLDGVRALAAVYVVLHHIWYTVWIRGTATAPQWTDWLNYGRFAVDVFLMLSGFCLMLPIVRGDGSLRGGAVAFFKKRARRILPPYYAALAFSLLLIFLLIGKPTGGSWDVTLPVTWRDVVVHLLLLQDFSAYDLHKINHVFWSISLEWWIYFLFPGLVLAWKRFGAGITTTVTIVGAYILWWVFNRAFHDTFSVNFIALFVLGMLGCELAHTRTPAIHALRDRLPWGAVTAASGVLLLAAMTGKIRHFSSGDLVDLLVGLFAMCLLVTISLRPQNLLRRALSQNAVVLVGSFAYSLYLIHAPIIAALWQYCVAPLHLAAVPALLLLELVGTPLIIAIAYGFHLLFERPFMSNPGKPAVRTERQAEAAAIESPAP